VSAAGEDDPGQLWEYCGRDPSREGLKRAREPGDVKKGYEKGRGRKM